MRKLVWWFFVGLFLFLFWPAILGSAAILLNVLATLLEMENCSHAH